ncbi:methyltransferase domain-containing protein [Glycomyces sp. YM15]|uniref:methyltransferase domain-containing protein n=1 Tax=Glycomyces sp. YM15 TaxID=2800446 RepID=UPI0019647AA4|nr:methyltransferase domain-containing protein [Glycomyces sp. YM15]
MAQDLMFQAEIRHVIRSTYGRLPNGAGRTMAARLYRDDQLDGLPDEAIDWSLGVGNPVAHAALRPGERVVDLSPRKSRALAEAARVLRPGGRLRIADFVVNDDLPPEVLTSAAAWAGCLSGALSESVLVKKLAKAGFTEIELGERTPFGIDDIAVYPLFDDAVIELMRRTVPAGQQRRIATSVIAKARFPG